MAPAAGRPKKKDNLEPFNIRRRINEREKDTAATTRGEDELVFRLSEYKNFFVFLLVCRDEFAPDVGEHQSQCRRQKQKQRLFGLERDCDSGGTGTGLQRLR